MSSKREREREYARRRHEKWLAHQAALEVRNRRTRLLARIALGVAVVAGLVWIAVMVTNSLRADAALDALDDIPTEAATEDATEETAVAPDPSVAEDRTWAATVTTSAGDLVLELDGQAAPQAVASFVTLAQDGFFDTTTCHRLLASDPNFVLQCGDPTGLGTGGPDWRFGPIENAPADGVYPAGTVAMARARDDASSMGSQFFLVYRDSTFPDDEAGGYTVFGRVVEGLDVLEEVASAGVLEGTDSPATQVTIEKVETQ